MKIPDYLVAPKTDFEKIELSFDFQSYKQLLNDESHQQNTMYRPIIEKL